MFLSPLKKLGSSRIIATLTAIAFVIGWTVFVVHLIKTARVNQGADHWVDLARSQAYGLCYNGCNDCVDVGRIEDACLLTRKVTVPGAVCDASKIWTWADRYPLQCLMAVGNIYKEKALFRKKILLGLLLLLNILALGVFKIIYIISEKVRHQIRHRPVRRTRRNSATTPLLAATTASLLAIALIPPVSAYRCTEKGLVHDQYFINDDRTLYGIIHGWLGNCHDETTSCGETCSTATADGKTSCQPDWCSEPVVDRFPSDYVNSAAFRVMSCGFRVTNVVPGKVDRRIANPRIEGDLWVKVAVNRFNGTEGVLEQVLCLYDMVRAP